MQDTRTLKQLAQEALDIQDACNLSGLVYGWARSMRRLIEVANFSGTDARNQHPINQLWASKVHDLARMGLSDCDSFAEAYATCVEMAK